MSFVLASELQVASLVSDGDVSALLSVQADLDAVLAFEIELAHSQAALRLIPAESARAIAQLDPAMAWNREKLVQGIRKDGIIIPALLDQLREKLAPEARPHLHFGATSQDAIDTSFMLRARKICAHVKGEVQQTIHAIENLSRKFGARPLMAQTRMQAALPIKVADRLATWRQAYADANAALEKLVFPLQLGGPVGTLDKFGPDAAALRTELGRRLGLHDPGHSWHTNRTAIADLAQAFNLVSAAGGKCGSDLLLMAQSDRQAIKLKGGGGSSSMPHKHNPVEAEVLVALARFNAVQGGGVNLALVHEQERSGTAWTLEWLLLPQMLLAGAASARSSHLLLDHVERIGA